MREVSVRMLHFILDLARAGEIDEAPLIDGLSSLEPPGGEIDRWLDWGDFVELIERLEKAAGGSDGVARMARLALPTAYPEVRAVAAIFLTPMSLFSFVTMRLIRTSFRNVETVELERFDDGRIRWRETIPPHHRGSDAFHRISRTMAALIPRHLDLPEAEAKITSMTPHVAEFEARFLPLPLTARGRQAVSAATSLIAAQLEAAFAHIVETTRVNGTSSDADSSKGNGADRWANTLELSPRQRDVFALLVKGRANKDIAGALQCSERNVEFHVGRILRAARVTSRAELLVKVLATKA